MIVNVLCATVGEIHGVGAVSDTGTVIRLPSSESRAGVVVCYCIVVCEGRDLVRINFHGMSHSVRHSMDSGTDSYSMTYAAMETSDHTVAS